MSHIVSAISARPGRSALRASAGARLGAALAAVLALWALTGWALGWWGPA
ncbi:hypothetical protein [Bordetella petrii]|nr:hypothetical protein [Bordetella petrii]MBO1111468.1 hypothetical protein [Bordetella petrii]